MATYKVIQDIEAEDHILGPLSLRQFIYALVSVFCLYISFICLTKGVAFLLVLFLPPALFTGFFAFPFGKDQPTEVWALAKLRFLFKPRLRIWNQSGVKELVTITVPKKLEHRLTNGLSENEVNSRLQALASTIDSRGWAIKNVNVNLYSQPSLLAGETDSDRLIDINSMPQEVPNNDVQASDDILDEQSNPIAQQFDQLINASSQAHRQQLINTMNSAPGEPAAPAAANWFLNQTPPAGSRVPATSLADDGAAIVTPGSVATNNSPNSPDEAALTAQLKAQNDTQVTSYGHLRTLQPLGSDPTPAASDSLQPASSDPQTAANRSGSTSPAGPDPAILNLASNNDLNVATLAREAQKAKDGGGSLQDEVVISLR